MTDTRPDGGNPVRNLSLRYDGANIELILGFGHSTTIAKLSEEQLELLARQSTAIIFAKLEKARRCSP